MSLSIREPRFPDADSKKAKEAEAVGLVEDKATSASSMTFEVFMINIVSMRENGSEEVYEVATILMVLEVKRALFFSEGDLCSSTKETTPASKNEQHCCGV